LNVFFVFSARSFHYLQLVKRFIGSSCNHNKMILLCSSVKNLPCIPPKNIYENIAGVMQNTHIMSLHCKDIGMDCSFETHGTTKHELMREFIDHAESAHKMQVLSADVIFKVHNAIITNSFSDYIRPTMD